MIHLTKDNDCRRDIYQAVYRNQRKRREYFLVVCCFVSALLASGIACSRKFDPKNQHDPYESFVLNDTTKSTQLANLGAPADKSRPLYRYSTQFETRLLDYSYVRNGKITFEQSEIEIEMLVLLLPPEKYDLSKGEFFDVYKPPKKFIPIVHDGKTVGNISTMLVHSEPGTRTFSIMAYVGNLEFHIVVSKVPFPYNQKELDRVRESVSVAILNCKV